MEAEIIAVGTELLLGDILNTNAQFLSRELAALGINVHFQSVVGDNPARLASVVEQGKARSDLLVFSGGLGPTDDDLTKQTVARVFGDALRFDEEECERIRAFFSKWGRTMPENNKKQAYVPVNGQKLVNHNGTAPGMIFESNGKYAILLPGPPDELQAMFLESVKPWLAAQSDAVLHSTVLRVAGIGESHLESCVAHLLAGENPTAALYAKTAEVIVRITARAKTEAEAETMCDEMAEQFIALLGDAVYARDADSIEEVLVKTLAAQGQTVALAESCTGGLLAQRLTSVPGASEVFSYGAVTYANEIKQQMLGVKAETLQSYGAVSSETAAEMALGVRAAAGASFGLAVTGIAGPSGGTPQKPVGTVYVAVTDGETVYVQKLVATNRSRDSVRGFSAQYAFDMLRRLVLGKEQPLCTAFPASEAAHLIDATHQNDQ